MRLLLIALSLFALPLGAQVDWASTEAETLKHFQALVRMNTNDPPGDETPAVNYLKDGIVIALSFYRGKAIGVELPNFVDLKVIKTEPGIKGDTAQNATKPAVLESGYTLQVPLFLEEGEVVKIDTRTGQYMTRVTR